MALKTSAKKRASNTAYRKNNPDRYRIYQDRYRVKYPERYLWRIAKTRAEKRGIRFEIEPDDISIPRTCEILGIEMKIGVGSGAGGNFDSASLDRIDPTKGYVPGNVQVISHLANSMKNNATPAQLKRFASWVRRTYGRTE